MVWKAVWILYFLSGLEWIGKSWIGILESSWNGTGSMSSSLQCLCLLIEMDDDARHVLETFFLPCMPACPCLQDPLIHRGHAQKEMS